MHFYTLVVIPKDISYDCIEAETWNILERFNDDSDEYKIVEPEIYVRKFKSTAKEIIDNLYRTSDKLKDIFIIDRYQKMFKEKKYKEIILERNSYEEDEKGNLGYTYNPDGLYDWAVIGGRWNGVLTNKNNELNDEYSNNIDGNYCMIGEYINNKDTNIVPAYLIFEDTYKEFGEKELMSTFKSYLKKNFKLDDKLVVVDMHN